jgi:RNA polymerase sigma-70 factor (ECF subfamily)
MTDLHRSAQAEAEIPPAQTLSREFETLFTSYFGFVCRTLQRLGVREADVNDVAQELFLAVHHALPDWDRSRSEKPWLFGFAVRFASNYRRLGWHRGRALDEDLHAFCPGLNDQISAKLTVLRALESLDFDKRVALVMHDLEQFTAKEIASELGIPQNTVSSRVRLARDAFRDAVERAERSDREATA